MGLFNSKEDYLDTNLTVFDAIHLNDLKLLRKLIRDGRSVDIMDEEGWRPLHQASNSRKKNNHLLVEELLKHENTDVNWRTNDGKTALSLVCRHNSGINAENTIEILLKYKADPNIADNNGFTPFVFAIICRLTNVVQQLVREGGVDINISYFMGLTPLHIITISGGDQLMTQTLLNLGANLESKDSCQMTPIFMAALKGRAKCLKILVEKALKHELGYLLDEGTDDGISPLMIAAKKGFTDCIELLLKSGANHNSIDKNGFNAIHFATESGHHKILGILLQKMDVKQMQSQLQPDLQELKIRNPLHLAIRENRLECLKVLLRFGFAIDSIDYSFQIFSLAEPPPKYITPLGCAVGLNQKETSELLLMYGANVNSTHPNVFAPSHCVFSLEEDHKICQMLELLTKHKANVNYCRTDEEPNELLHSFFNPLSLKLLLEYGLDMRTCFKEGYINRFLELSSDCLSLNWNQLIGKVLPVVIPIVERNGVVREHIRALAHHIESKYQMGFGINGYNPSVLEPIYDLFKRPHSLKECARISARRYLYSKCRQLDECFPDFIQSLELPISLKDYLLFKEFSVNPILE